MARVKQKKAEARREDAARAKKVCERNEKKQKGLSYLERSCWSASRRKLSRVLSRCRRLGSTRLQQDFFQEKRLSSVWCAWFCRTFALIYASSRRQCFSCRQLDRRIWHVYLKTHVSLQFTRSTWPCSQRTSSSHAAFAERATTVVVASLKRKGPCGE